MLDRFPQYNNVRACIRQRKYLLQIDLFASLRSKRILLRKQIKEPDICSANSNKCAMYPLPAERS